MLAVFSGCAWANCGPEGRLQFTQQPYPAAAFSSKQFMGSQPFVLDPVCVTESDLPLLGPQETSRCAEPGAGGKAWLPIIEGLVMTHQHLGPSCG